MLRGARLLGLFLLCLLVLEAAWMAARPTQFNRWLIDEATVGTSTALINLLTPKVAASAHESSIVASGGGINVRSGCEGTEVLLPLIAALLASPISWRMRLFAGLTGTALVFALNQLRLLALFYSFRIDPVLFGRIHGFVGPLLLDLGVLVFFQAVLRRNGIGRRWA